MSLSLGLGFVVGVLLPFIIRGEWGIHLITISIFGGFLAIVFCAIGVLIGVTVNDKMRGVGLAFAIWFYFVLAHDALVLVLLLVAKNYPMDTWAAVLAALNPIGLTRVILLVQQDASMLLGHSGALIREILLGRTGLMTAIGIGLFWIVVPISLAMKSFLKRDL